MRLSIGLVLFTYAIALITQAAFYLIPVQLPFYLRELTNATASQSGLAIAVSPLFVAAGSFLYQRLKAGFGLGLLVPNMNLCLVSITPSALRGRVLGGWTTCLFLGQFLYRCTNAQVAV